MQAEAVTAIHDAQAVDVTSLTKDDTEVAVTPLAPVKRDEPVVTRRVCGIASLVARSRSERYTTRNSGVTTVCTERIMVRYR